uniref:Uncharacterized protein n=1 Tax=Molossus molossus TaxID=27622 RepID=A0A7J8GKV3_MOLMO|nr:hypothetical protein HJG59_011470 [Molossus molossus]
MVKQRNKSQMKEQENSTEEGLNEMELNKLSKVVFRVMIMRTLNTMNKHIETMKINQLETKNHQVEINNDIAEIKNALERVTHRLEEAEDWISKLEDSRKNHPVREPKEKTIKKQEDSLREL